MKALITGVNGQCGSYLSELLLFKEYEVHGVHRRSSQNTFKNIEHIQDRITLHYADMTDAFSLFNIIKEVEPDEIYNLAGMSQVRVSYDVPANTFAVNTFGLLHIINAVRALKLNSKIYQAGSSEMFGKVLESPQKETTPFYPRSPYGASKAAAFYIARIYRESYGMKIYNGILFNNESPRRGTEFLSRKVCMGIAEIVNGQRDKLVLGNLEAKRDFGYSKEYMSWVWRMLQHDTPDDFVIATGETHSVKEFVAEAFSCAGITDWERYVTYDPNLMRPAEVDLLIGDASKSKKILGFEPQVKFRELVKIMMESELK